MHSAAALQPPGTGCCAGIKNSRQLALGIFDQNIHTSTKASSAAAYA
jgi:hypothetical protein